MGNHKLRRAIALTAVLGGLGVSQASADVPVRAAQTANPFERLDAFCVQQAPPLGVRNSNNPGVTPSSITIGDQSIDQAALRRLGVVVADLSGLMNIYLSEINKCGGINGRRLVVKKALFNPTAPDQPGHQQAICLKLTEDAKAFVIMGGTSALLQRCMAILHKSIVEAPFGVPSQDFKDAKGRIVSPSPAGDTLAEAFVEDAIRQGVLKGKKITVVSNNLVATSVGDARRDYIDLLKSKGIDADLEVLPCSGRVCSSGDGAAVRRMKDSGTNLIILSHATTVATPGPLFNEMRRQNLKAQIWGPDNTNVNTDVALTGVVSAATSDALSYIDDNGWYSVGLSRDINGAWRSGKYKDSEFAKMCHRTLAKATGKPEIRYTNQTIDDGTWSTPVGSCLTVRNMARAIWSLGNNVTTERMVVALRNLKDESRRDNVPMPKGLPSYYSANNLAPTVVTTMKFSYPCPLPTVDRTKGCMLPLDTPLRFRAVR
ncbi:MAG: hypothetical protein JWO68_1129 [Actinomycetia bacterium]|nr:hypothetical protein [Actinomycetes bacterium]